jgi:hypothetical protein
LGEGAYGIKPVASCQAALKSAPLSGVEKCTTESGR